MMTSRREFLGLVGAGVLPDAVGRPHTVPLRVILVPTLREAETILDRLKAGEPFASLARQYSVDRSATQGGYIGRIDLSGLRPEIREAVQRKRPGDFTDVVKTPWGYMILEVAPESKRPGLGDATPDIGSVRPAPLNYQTVTSVIGDTEEEAFFRRFPKPPNYQQNLIVNCRARRKAVEVGLHELEEKLAASPPGGADADEAKYSMMRTHYALGQLLSYQGKMQEAISQFSAAHDLAASMGVAEYKLALEKVLGVAELRRGEVENCLHHHNVHMCILPLGPDGQHALRAGSENAVEHFLKYLDQKPDDLEEKWLLNIAYMTLGKYPHQVPSQFLIPSAVFESKASIGRFTDVAPTLGIDAFGTAGGVIIDDFDNDGFLDVVISGMDACQQLRYFHNNGNGTFTDRTEQAGLTGQLGGLNIIQTDYNNDGWLDIYVMRGGWSVPVRHSLLRNNGDGTFSDVTLEAGLAIPATASQTAVWADFDNDGRLDLFVGNENSPAQLFRNNGDGTFVDIAHAAGVDRMAFTKGVVAGDYDNDGYPDLYVSNYRGENFLYHNNGNWTFTDVAPKLGVVTPILSFPVWFFDYDNDGWLDLLVTSYIVSITEVMRSYMKLPVQAERLKLYKNMGGTFKDVTKETGLDRVFMPMGANFGDVDNDGFLDFYLGTGSPSYASLVPNVLFKNIEGRHFVDITTSSGTGSLQKGHGVAIADIFNDGQPAIFSELGGMAPGDRYYSSLFKNPGTGNNWINVKLVGVKTNRGAIGARIKVTVRGQGGRPRSIYRDVSSGGSFGASPLEQHIGLGKAGRIDSLEVWWPTSRERQVFHDVPINQFIEVREFAKTYTRLKRRVVG
jgi:tetratricopeptide (TPR) repeat protein